jgi:integrase
MNPVRRGLQHYLVLRRRLGFDSASLAGRLDDFVRFLEAEAASHITTALALRWATQPVDAQPATWSQRLGMVRRFAAWFNAFDPRTEVPAQGLLPHRFHRQRPYVYSDREIERIMQTAAGLPSPKGLRGRTYSTLFGLLAVTGMRISEALSLDRDDVDLIQGGLFIRKTKFRKSRLVPLHVSTQDVLQAYAKARDRHLPRPDTRAFFLSEQGGQIRKWNAHYTFAQVCRRIGLRPAGQCRGRVPRLHDLRHRFAVRTLIDWYRAGVDVEREITKLATYLGHTHVNDTYWYIEAVPELLQLATERLERLSTGREI